MSQSQSLPEDAAENAVVAVCLCTRLGRGEATVPLDAREWTELVVALHQRSATPRDLLDANAPERSPRIEELLRGLGSVGVEAERLETNGIWVLTRGDDEYPRAWKDKLGAHAPVVLFGAGPKAVFGADLLTILFSRKTDSEGEAFARMLADRCAAEEWRVVTGGMSFGASFGFGIDVLAGGLERETAKKATREAILAGELTLLTPYLPSDLFTNDRAKMRNKLIYSLSGKACVVSTGGHAGTTASGAREALRDSLAKVWTRASESALIREGAIPIEEPLAATMSEILRDFQQGTFGF